MSRPIPPAIAKLGITGIRDNIPEGMEVGGFTRDFVRIFRPEIEAALRRRACEKEKAGDSKNSPSA